MRDFEQVTREVFGTVYGSDAQYSQNDHVWRLPGGAMLELGHLEAHSDLQKFQGRSVGMMVIDEVGQYASPELPDLLRANIRAPKGVPTRLIYSANPGGIGQTWLWKRFIKGNSPWIPFKDEQGEYWTYCPSTLADNPEIDQEKYRAQLQAACQHDPEMLKAWLDGSFLSATGAFFGTSFDEKRNIVEPFAEIPTQHGKKWKTHLAMDWGSAAPSVTYLMAESPGAAYQERWYPRGSFVAVDEIASARRDNPNKGLNWTTSITADAIKEMCKRWRVPPSGCADDSIFNKTGANAGSIADELKHFGVSLSPANKMDRMSGWARMRQMLSNAGSPELPGLYLTRSCTYALETLPFLGRDQRRPEDLDTSSADHAADALRYALCYRRMAMGSATFGWAR